MMSTAAARAVSWSAKVSPIRSSRWLLPNHRQAFATSSIRSFSGSSNIQLNYDWIQKPKVHNDHVVVFLHGLLGNGRNLRTMAKKLCESHNQPGLLLDVRGHGGSQLEQPQPSTFNACVEDLQYTLEKIPEITSDTKVTLVGHSLGGRISLQAAFNSLQNNEQNQIHRVWLLDTVPGQADKSVEQVIGAVTEISKKSAITDKKELVKKLTSSEYGIDKGIALWLASSLQTKKETGTLEFGFDLTVANDLLADFHSQDFMGMMEKIVVEHGIRVDLVCGGKNTGWSESVLGPLREMEKRDRGFCMHTLPKAGHWVHVEDLPGLLASMDVSDK